MSENSGNTGNLNELPLSNFLENMLVKNNNIKELLEKLTFKFDDKLLSILKNILAKSPDSLNRISVNIRDILKDGLINHKDIPKMFILVANLYKTEFNTIIKDLSLTSKQVIDFIKFLISLMIDLDYVKVNNKQEAFESIDNSSVLLELVIPSENINNNVTNVNNSCCAGFFNCKK